MDVDNSTFLMGGVVNEDVFNVIESDLLEKESLEFEESFLKGTQKHETSNLTPIQFFKEKNGNGPSGRFSG